MRTTLIATFSVVIVFGLVSVAQGQLAAGSPEDKAYTQITTEKNVDAKLALLVDFEKQFPQSKALPGVYDMMIDIYTQKNNTDKVVEVGEKAVKLDPEDVTNLLVLSRHYGDGRKNVTKAVTYAQKAVDSLAKMRAKPTPATATDADWKKWLDENENSAKAILNWAKSL